MGISLKINYIRKRTLNKTQGAPASCGIVVAANSKHTLTDLTECKASVAEVNFSGLCGKVSARIPMACFVDSLRVPNKIFQRKLPLPNQQTHFLRDYQPF